ncbi:nadph-cytochrome p450 reductase, putative, partial [Ichthyophthirius multifiliis]
QTNLINKKVFKSNKNNILNDKHLNEKIKTRGLLTIYYGTRSGTSQRFAYDILLEAEKNHYQANLINLSEFEPNQFISSKYCIFLLSTYGKGGPTNDAAKFFDWLNNQKDTKLLSDMKYTIFGLGNSSYDEFCGMSVKTNNKLQELGARLLYQFGKGDAGKDSTVQDFVNWKQDLWDCLNGEFKIQEISRKELSENNCPIGIQEIKNDKEINLENFSFGQIAQLSHTFEEYFNSQLFEIQNIREIRQKSKISTPCYEIEFNLGKQIYQTAGNIAIFPENSNEKIQEFASLLNLDLEKTIKINPKNMQVKIPIPNPIKIKTFLQKFCDFQGPINRAILQSLKFFLLEEKQRALFDEWTSNTVLFEQNIIQKKHSLLSLVKTFQIQIPLLNLILLSPIIMPRYYTISSSQKLSPSSFQILVSVLEVQRPDGQYEEGQCSQYFSSLLKEGFKGKKVRAFFEQSTFQVPQSAESPIVMVSAGAGLAPMRALLKEKQFYEQKDEQNQIFGEILLYFGCRNDNQDFIYKEELQNFQKEHVCEKQRFAFSQQQGKEKQYVQDLMKEDLDILHEQLIQKKGYLYVCGSKLMGESIKELIAQILQEKEGVMPYLANVKVQEMEKQGKIKMEIWG